MDQGLLRFLSPAVAGLEAAAGLGQAAGERHFVAFHEHRPRILFLSVSLNARCHAYKGCAAGMNRAVARLQPRARFAVWLGEAGLVCCTFCPQQPGCGESHNKNTPQGHSRLILRRRRTGVYCAARSHTTAAGFCLWQLPCCAITRRLRPRPYCFILHIVFIYVKFHPPVPSPLSASRRGRFLLARVFPPSTWRAAPLSCSLALSVLRRRMCPSSVRLT